MTPKEKAEELFNDFYWDLENDYKANRCALIAVNKIISCLEDDDLYIQGETNINEIIDYWQQVKQEIELL